MILRITLDTTSLRAANFRDYGEAGGIEWSGTRKRAYYISPKEMKRKWLYLIKQN